MCVIGELLDGRVTEIESRNVDFLEEDFLSRSEICKYVELYKIQHS